MNSGRESLHEYSENYFNHKKKGGKLWPIDHAGDHVRDHDVGQEQSNAGLTM